MIGCVTAISSELATHTTVFEQFTKAPLPILGTFALITAASFVTILKVRSTSAVQKVMHSACRAVTWRSDQ